MLLLPSHSNHVNGSGGNTQLAGGIVHVITNVGNVSPEIPGGNHPSCSVQQSSRSSQSLLLIDVNGKMLSARVFDQNMAELDTFAIAK